MSFLSEYERLKKKKKEEEAQGIGVQKSNGATKTSNNAEKTNASTKSNKTTNGSSSSSFMDNYLTLRQKYVDQQKTFANAELVSGDIGPVKPALSARERKLATQEKRLDEDYEITKSDAYKVVSSLLGDLQNNGFTTNYLDPNSSLYIRQEDGTVKQNYVDPAGVKDKHGLTFSDYADLLNYATDLTSAEKKQIYQLNQARINAIDNEIAQHQARYDKSQSEKSAANQNVLTRIQILNNAKQVLINANSLYDKNEASAKKTSGKTQSSVLTAITAMTNEAEIVGISSFDQKDKFGMSMTDYGNWMNYSDELSTEERKAIYKLNQARIKAYDKEIETAKKTGNGNIEVLESQKKLLVDANATYDKYGDAASLPSKDLYAKANAVEDKDTDAYLYYLGLAHDREVTELGNFLKRVKMPNEDVSVYDAAQEVAKMEDGDEKSARVEQVKAAMDKTGVTFDDWYSLITGDGNTSAGNFTKWAGNATGSGWNSFNEGVTGFLDWVIGEPLKNFGWENNPISEWHENFEDEGKKFSFNQEWYKDKMGGGRGYDLAGQFLAGVAGAVPHAALTMMTAGASAGTSSASLSTTAAMNTASGTQKAGMIAQNLLKNPQWQMSFVQESGSNYYDAIEAGATPLEASTHALLTGTANATIETGLTGESGIQGVAQNINKGSRFWKAIKDSTLQEMAEEPLQGVVSRASAKDFYGADEEVFDLGTMATEGFMGGGVGLFLGGGKATVQTAVNAHQQHQLDAEALEKFRKLTDAEKQVVDKVYEAELATKEKDGETLTEKQKTALYDNIIEQMDKGYITIDAIEETLGGDTYNQLQELTKQEEEDIANFKKMYEGEELKKRVDNYLSESKKGDLQTQLSEEVKNLVSGSRLAESYNEQTRKGVNFTVDEETMSRYGKKYRDTFQRAMDSGVLNNTNRSHELVELVAKVEADKGVKIDFTDNEKLAEHGFSVEGATINGVVDADGNIKLNVQSKKYLNSVTGHEVMHVLEGTDLYQPAADALFEYAKMKGEYDSRYKAIDALYSNKEGYKGKDGQDLIKKELAADLAGDYLFTDADFIKNLSVKHRNIFEKIYDEIKYLCKVATAGSAEARQLERVKKTFEDAYRADTKGVTETKLSLSESKADSDGKQLTEGQREYFQHVIPELRDDNGNLKVLYHGTPNNFTQFNYDFIGSNGTALGKGFYLTDNKQIAEGYVGENGKVMELYANITKPMSLTDMTITEDEYRNFVVAVDKATEGQYLTNYGEVDYEGYQTVLNRALEDYEYNDNDVDLVHGVFNAGGLSWEEGFRLLKDTLGYDGVVENNYGGTGSSVFVPTLPEQIKSVDNAAPTKNPDIRYSLSDSGIDKSQNLVYNGRRGDTYVRTDDFRNLQAESQRMSDEEIQQYHSGRQLDSQVQGRLSRTFKLELQSRRSERDYSVRALLNPKTGSKTNIVEDVEGSLFHDVFEIARKHLENGELVDLHEIETTEDGIGYNDCHNYLSEDGLSGFSITPEGDLISVFNLSDERGFLKTIAPIVKERAKTLDCYESPIQPLHWMYEKVLGFKVASEMDWNPKYDHDNIGNNHNEPKVAFMVNTEKDVETRNFTKDQYDEAVAYRNSFVEQATDNTVASFMPKTAENPYSLSKQSERPKRYGNFNISGEDVRLWSENDISPVAETVQTPDTDALFEEWKALRSVKNRTEAQNLRMAELKEQISEQDKAAKMSEYELLADDIAPIELEAQTAMDMERLNSLEDSDMPPVPEAPYYEEPTRTRTPSNPFAERDYDETLKKAKPFTEEHPEVVPYFKQAAQEMLYDVDNSTPGRRYTVGDWNLGTERWTGDKRNTTEDVARLKDGRYGYTYDQIRDGLKRIVNGEKLNTLAKRLEFDLHDRLVNGYTDVNGTQIPPNQEYIDLLNQMQTMDEAYQQHLDSMEYVDDSFAPIAEDVAPVAKPVAAPAQNVTSPIADAPMMKSETNVPVKPNPEEGRNARVLTEEPEAVTEERSSWQYFMRNFVDKKSIFEKLSLETGNRELQARADSLHRADSSAQYFMKNGNKAAGVKPLADIRKTVQKSGKEQAFSDYVYHVHNIDRMSLESRVAPRIAELKQILEGMTDEQIQELAKESVKVKTPADEAAKIKAAKEFAYLSNVKNKPVFGEYTAGDSRGFVAEFERNNPEFKEWAQDLYDYSNYLRDMMIENGIISQETAGLWQSLYPHYVPIRRDGKNGAAINVALDTNKTGINAPIKRATGGNSDILPLFDTLGARTVQTFNAVAKNRFGVELKNTLNSTIAESDTTLDDATEGVENHEGWLQEGKDGMNPTFTVFEDGKRVTFEISEDMFDAMKPTSEFLSKKVLKGIPNKISNFRRGVLTEYNPYFLLTNAAKDVQDILVNSQHPAKTYANLPVALKEILSSGKYYQEYLENGGDQVSYFERETNTFEKEKSALRKVVGFPLDAISAANNVVERLPRLAEYIASRKQGRSIDVSMLDSARVTTNFAAGGDVTKFLNRNGFTFLNASVQGAAQQVRNIREAKHKGLRGWVGLAAKYTIAGLPALLLNSMLWGDDDEYEELSDYVKQDYYIVGKNADGTFIRIPKGRTVSVIQNAFEQMGNLITGDDEVDFGQFFGLVMNNLAPNNPIDNNIISPFVQAATNTTWYGDDLVPSRLQDLPAEEQYDESTDAISRWLGEATGISPYKINYLLDQYSGVLGDAILPTLTPDAERGDGNIFTAPFLDKFTTDPVMKNQNVSDFYTKMDELTVNANGSKATDDDILKSKYFNSINSELSELYAQKREIQNDTTLSDEDKYAEVRAIQQQIVDLTKEGLSNYENIQYEGNRDYAVIGDSYFQWYKPEVGDPYWRKLSDEQTTKYNLTKNAGGKHYVTDGKVHYRLDEKGEWTKISDKQLERQKEVTKSLGVTPEEYWSKTEISFMPMSNGEYEYAYDNPENYAIAKAVGGYDSYRTYSKELYNIKADKDANGKTINGSRKKKVMDYIESLDIDRGEKLILHKSEYPSDDDYNQDIIDYLNGRDDISYSEMETILKELGFTVDSIGNIYWD